MRDGPPRAIEWFQCPRDDVLITPPHKKQKWTRCRKGQGSATPMPIAQAHFDRPARVDVDADATADELPPAQPGVRASKYHGVRIDRKSKSKPWRVGFSHAGKYYFPDEGCYHRTEEEAARTYDALVRQLELAGERSLNFPRPGEPIVPNRSRAPSPRGPRRSRYAGVTFDARAERNWRGLVPVRTEEAGRVRNVYTAACHTSEEAARARDDLVRKLGLVGVKLLNFPREGEGESAIIGSSDDDDGDEEEEEEEEEEGEEEEEEEEEEGESEEVVVAAVEQATEVSAALGCSSRAARTVPFKHGGSSSRYYGVARASHSSGSKVRWQVQFSCRGAIYRAGSNLQSEEEAARAYDDLVRARRLLDARPLNFPRPEEAAAQAALLGGCVRPRGEDPAAAAPAPGECVADAAPATSLAAKRMRTRGSASAGEPPLTAALLEPACALEEGSADLAVAQGMQEAHAHGLPRLAAWLAASARAQAAVVQQLGAERAERALERAEHQRACDELETLRAQLQRITHHLTTDI